MRLAHAERSDRSHASRIRVPQCRPRSGEPVLFGCPGGRPSAAARVVPGPRRGRQRPELTERGVNALAVRRTDKIEQESPEDCKTEACAGARRPRVGITSRAGSRPVQPVIDEAGQQRGEWRLAPARPGVALEEQALGRPQARIAQPRPQRVDGVTGRRVESGEELVVGRLDGSNHLGEQSLPRPEVVDEHPMAGASRGGDIAQRAITDAVALERVNDSRQEVLPCHGPDCTMWYMYHVVQPLQPRLRQGSVPDMKIGVARRKPAHPAPPRTRPNITRHRRTT